MPSHKLAKISSELVRVISEIIFDTARDEILKTVTITGAKVSKDLGYAKVYFTSLSDLDKKTLVKEVVYDDSIEYANRIENIIKEIHEDE